VICSIIKINIKMQESQTSENRALTATLTELQRSILKLHSVTIRPFTGDGEEDVIDWLEEYEYLTEAAGWDDQARFTKVAAYLHGTARRWYSAYGKPGLPNAPRDFEGLKVALIKGLCPTNYRSFLIQKNND
jgi:hypothetical protein